MDRYSSMPIAALIALLGAFVARAQTPSTLSEGAQAMTQRGSGPFDVKITPQSEDKAEGAPLGHFYELSYTLP